MQICIGEQEALSATLQFFEQRSGKLEGLEYYQERRLKGLGLLDEDGRYGLRRPQSIDPLDLATLLAKITSNSIFSKVYGSESCFAAGQLQMSTTQSSVKLTRQDDSNMQS